MSLVSQLQALKTRKFNALQDFAVRILTTAQVLVARDTGYLEASLGISPVQTIGHQSKIDIGTLLYPVFYAQFVERGTRGRSKRYHRDKRVVFEGDGQHFLQRSLQAHRADLLPFIKAA